MTPGRRQMSIPRRIPRRIGMRHPFGGTVFGHLAQPSTDHAQPNVRPEQSAVAFHCKEVNNEIQPIHQWLISPHSIKFSNHLTNSQNIDGSTGDMAIPPPARHSAKSTPNVFLFKSTGYTRQPNQSCAALNSPPSRAGSRAARIGDRLGNRREGLAVPGGPAGVDGGRNAHTLASGGGSAFGETGARSARPGSRAPRVRFFEALRGPTTKVRAIDRGERGAARCKVNQVQQHSPIKCSSCLASLIYPLAKRTGSDEIRIHKNHEGSL